MGPSRSRSKTTGGGRISSVARRPDGQWRARYRDEGGTEHARHFSRKFDAQRWLDEVTASVVTGQYVDPKAGRTLLRDYAARWEAAQVSRASTARILDNALRLHLLPALGNRPLASIRRSDVQALVKGLADQLAPGTVRNVHAVAVRLFAAAVDDRLIVESPCRRITLPAPDGGEVVPPTAEQVRTLATTVPDRYRAVVILLAGSGLRIGELLGLRVTDVDYLRRELRVERQRLQDGTLAPPKTPQSVRTVPLGRVVVDELAAHLTVYGNGGEWLFTTSTGTPLGYSAWRQIWRSARRASSLDVDTHGLRHFYASALIDGGASVKQVSALLGHASAVVTLKVYAHLWPGDDERARSVVDAALDVVRTGRGLDDHG